MRLHLYTPIDTVNIDIYENISGIFYVKRVHVGNDQEKAQSEKVCNSKSRGVEKTKFTIKYLCLENIS